MSEYDRYMRTHWTVLERALGWAFAMGFLAVMLSPLLFTLWLFGAFP